MARSADRLFELVSALYERRALVELGSVFLVLDRDGRVLCYNLPAQRLLGSEDGLAIARDGILRALDGRSDQRLHLAIHECLADRQCDEEGNAGVVQVERAAGKPPFLVFIWPCLVTDAIADRGPGLQVVVNDPEQAEHSIQHLLTHLYDLTPSEAQVAMHLLKGESAKQIAEAREVAISTVRTQIRNLLMKTDTQRQSEFIALVFRCLSLMLR